MKDSCEVSVGQGKALVTHGCITPGSSSKPEAFAPALKAPQDVCVCTAFPHRQDERERLHKGTDNIKHLTTLLPRAPNLSAPTVKLARLHSLRHLAL